MLIAKNEVLIDSYLGCPRNPGVCTYWTSWYVFCDPALDFTVEWVTYLWLNLRILELNM